MTAPTRVAVTAAKGLGWPELVDLTGQPSEGAETADPAGSGSGLGWPDLAQPAQQREHGPASPPVAQAPRGARRRPSAGHEPTRQPAPGSAMPAAGQHPVGLPASHLTPAGDSAGLPHSSPGRIIATRAR